MARMRCSLASVQQCRSLAAHRAPPSRTIHRVACKLTGSGARLLRHLATVQSHPLVRSQSSWACCPVVLASLFRMGAAALLGACSVWRLTALGVMLASLAAVCGSQLLPSFPARGSSASLWWVSRRVDSQSDATCERQTVDLLCKGTASLCGVLRVMPLRVRAVLRC